MTSKKFEIAPVDGPLGVLTPGMGAVASTFIAGVCAVRKGLALPVGSLTQMGTARLGKRTDGRSPKIGELVPLADLTDLRFAGWDINDESCYDAACRSEVLERSLIEQVADDLKAIRNTPAVFEQKYVRNLHGTHVKHYSTKREAAELIREDIRRFKKELDVSRLVMVWCGSTETYIERQAVHQDLDAFERGLDENDHAIPPSMLYAYAAIQEGVPYVNGAPNLSADVPALMQLAWERAVPTAGKDFKTGQTLVKTVIGPMLKARMLGLRGWFSTNILGNRDGEVLDDPESFKSKEVTKLGVLDQILQPDLYPELYSNIYHKVRINYYPPRGDAKEGWDNIDIFGWLGYPMQLKIDFLCRDSILAAPLVLDLALFIDLARRAGMRGVQEWLSFFFKSPVVPPELYAENALFIQEIKLKNTLRHLAGEDLITHLGLDYYYGE
jgi:myo-inositol-1-phosphate synthase